MTQYQLELRMRKTQEKIAESWLPILGSVYNFAVRKIGLNAKDKIDFSKPEFQNLANRARVIMHHSAKTISREWPRDLVRARLVSARSVETNAVLQDAQKRWGVCRA
jgi:hypothetical protein